MNRRQHYFVQSCFAVQVLGYSSFTQLKILKVSLCVRERERERENNFCWQRLPSVLKCFINQFFSCFSPSRFEPMLGAKTNQKKLPHHQKLIFLNNCFLSQKNSKLIGRWINSSLLHINNHIYNNLCQFILAHIRT